MITSKLWAANSLFLDLHDSVGIKEFTYVCLCTAVVMLIHSSYLNKNKISTIRFYTDASCWSTVIASVLLLAALSHRNPRSDAFLVNLCVYGIFGTTVQLCDNYMTFSRYLVVYPKTTIIFKITVHLYIWFLLVFTYLPFETVLPCFMDTNSPSVSKMNTIFAGYIFMISYLLYNGYFSFKFWRALNNKNMFGGCSRKMVILGYKNLIHIFISSIGMVLQGLESSFSFEPLGCLASYFTVNIALHILFNWRIEKSIFFSTIKRQNFLKKWRSRLKKLSKRCYRLVTCKSGDNVQDNSNSLGWQQQHDSNNNYTSFQYIYLVVRRLLNSTKSNASSTKVSPLMMQHQDQSFIIRELMTLENKPQLHLQHQQQQHPHTQISSVNFVQRIPSIDLIEQGLLENKEEEDFENRHKQIKEMVLQELAKPRLNDSIEKEEEDEEGDVVGNEIEMVSKGKEDEIRISTIPQTNNNTTTTTMFNITAEALRYHRLHHHQQQPTQQQQQQQQQTQLQYFSSDIPLGELSSFSAPMSAESQNNQSQYHSSLELYNSVVPVILSSGAAVGSITR